MNPIFMVFMTPLNIIRLDDFAGSRPLFNPVDTDRWRRVNVDNARQLDVRQKLVKPHRVYLELVVGNITDVIQHLREYISVGFHASLRDNKLGLGVLDGLAK